MLLQQAGGGEVDQEELSGEPDFSNWLNRKLPAARISVRMAAVAGRREIKRAFILKALCTHELTFSALWCELGKCCFRWGSSSRRVVRPVPLRGFSSEPTRGACGQAGLCPLPCWGSRGSWPYLLPPNRAGILCCTAAAGALLAPGIQCGMAA